MKTFLTIALLGSAAAAFEHREAGRPLPAVAARSVLGPQECAECHENEFAVWKETHHERASRVLTRDPEAREIAKALGLRRIKDDERCAACHYTRRADDAGAIKAVAGVSCESCHGASREWLELHDDFGGPEETITTETAEHRRARRARCEAAGMRHQDDLYAIASTCFGCHVVSDDDILAAGHPSGAGFELVSWSQGEIRHNFVRDKERGNVPSAPGRRRSMFLLGRLLQLEHALEGLAAAAGSGAARPVLAQGVRDAAAALRSIAEIAPLAEVEQALAAVAQRALADTGDADALLRAAEGVAAAARSLASRDDLSGLEGLDPLIPDDRGAPAR